jgi:hypothetical protein
VSNDTLTAHTSAVNAKRRPRIVVATMPDAVGSHTPGPAPVVSSRPAGAVGLDVLEDAVEVAVDLVEPESTGIELMGDCDELGGLLGVGERGIVLTWPPGRVLKEKWSS